MAIKPNPYKLVCLKCGFSKVVAPKSDVLTMKDLKDMNPVCSKCGEEMEKEKLNPIDTILSIFK